MLVLVGCHRQVTPGDAGRGVHDPAFERRWRKRAGGIRPGGDPRLPPDQVAMAPEARKFWEFFAEARGLTRWSSSASSRGYYDPSPSTCVAGPEPRRSEMGPAVQTSQPFDVWGDGSLPNRQTVQTASVEVSEARGGTSGLHAGSGHRRCCGSAKRCNVEGATAGAGRWAE